MASKLRISDIQTEDVLYYDVELKNQCYKFCQRRDIDCLPSQDDPNLIYIRDDSADSFDVVPVTESRKIDAYQNAFCRETLEAFERNHVLLVHADGELSGVVHFSDFSGSAISVYLYELFFQYERSLRAYLRVRELHNDDMLAFFELRLKDDRNYQRKIKEFRKHIVEFAREREFQRFYLDDLIGLANEAGKIVLNNDVVKLRNMIMHAHELVDMKDWRTDNLVYDFESFRRFFELALALHADFRKVKNRIAFLAGV